MPENDKTKDTTMMYTKLHVRLLAIVFAAALISATAATGAAQITNTVRYTVSPESRLGFDGTSTLHDYSVTAEKLHGYVLIEIPMEDSDDIAAVDVVFGESSLTIPVQEMKSGKDKLDKKMYETMHVEDYPEIMFSLVSAETIERGDSTVVWFSQNISGDLTVNGQTQRLEVPVKTFLLPNGDIRIAGGRDIQMSDYGVERPKMFLGTLRTNDTVSISFDLVLTRDGK